MFSSCEESGSPVWLMLLAELLLGDWPVSRAVWMAELMAFGLISASLAGLARPRSVGRMSGAMAGCSLACAAAGSIRAGSGFTGSLGIGCGYAISIGGMKPRCGDAPGYMPMAACTGAPYGCEAYIIGGLVTG